MTAQSGKALAPQRVRLAQATWIRATIRWTNSSGRITRIAGTPRLILRLAAGLALIGVLTAHATANAQPAGSPRAPIPLDLPTPTHPWRMRLLWALDLMDTARGGRGRGWQVPALIDVRVTQHQRLHAWLDSRWHIDLIRILGSNPSRDAGDVQTLDNLAAHHAWRLYRAFWQLGDTRRLWTLRMGWQGYDEIFGLVPDGADLLNSSFGQMPTGSQAGMPIWPQTAPGISARWHPDALYVLAGLWSGVPRDPGLPQGWNLPRRGDGSLQALELGIQRHGRYKFAVGSWTLRSTRAATQAHHGVYALADARLLAVGAGGHLLGFLQWGRTQPRQSAVRRYMGAGLRWISPTRGRVSVGVARAALSRAFRARDRGGARAETAYELTWRYRLDPHLALQPDMQYIAHPALAAQATHALEIGLRIDGSF